MKRTILLSIITLLLTARAASAQFLTPAWVRPPASTQDTIYHHWDEMLQPAPTNAPDVAAYGPAGKDGPSVFDAAHPASGSFNPFTNNIYSFSGIIKPRAIVPSFGNANSTLSVLAQVASWGDEIDVNDVTANGVQISTLPGYCYTRGGVFPTSQGPFVYHHWTFDIPDTQILQIDWGWNVLSSSFTELVIDARSVANSVNLMGDATLDGRVDTLDFNALAGGFGITSGAAWSQGDFTGEGAVDSVDFGLLVGNYGAGATQAALGSVAPEPAALVATAALCLFGGRTRRGN